MNGFASLCFLSYNRPEFIFEAIRSATENAGYPCEVLVHDDGSTASNLHIGLLDMLEGGQISHLTLNPPGHNEGVGTAIRRMFDMASGDVLIKLDQDLLFTDGWLARTVGILAQDKAVGMLGGFKYHHEPVIWGEQKIDVPTLGGYHYTRQFCGSMFAVPRRIWDEHGRYFKQHLDAFNEDSDFMSRLRAHDFELALSDVDLMSNRGFGIGPSTVVEEGFKVHKIHHGPHILGGGDYRPDSGELPAQVEEDSPAVAVQENAFVSEEAAPNAKTCAPQIGVISPSVPLAAETHDFALRRFDVGVVITTCAGREENLKRCLQYIGDLRFLHPKIISIVYDGCSPEPEPRSAYAGDIPVWRTCIEKHQPGQTQPRNVGFEEMVKVMPELTHVWFLDSDLIVPSDTLEHFYNGFCAAPENRILIGPYDWLPEGVIGFIPEMKHMAPGQPTPRGMADYRWPSFNEFGPEVVHQAGRPPFDGEDEAMARGRAMGAGLANFSGNLIWPVAEFARVGGFHRDLYHGRCEDGELGLRACEHGIPMSFVRDARGWHVAHPVDMADAIEKNKREIPLLDAMHPWVQNVGLLVVDKDGKRFDWKCPDCDEIFNTLSYWEHAATHR